METTNIKEEAKRLVDRLPDDSTWDDLMHEIYVRQSIEKVLPIVKPAEPLVSKRFVQSLDTVD